MSQVLTPVAPSDALPTPVPAHYARLHQRHALLTGAGGGIGLAVARAYLEQGARCTVVDLAPSAPAQVQALADAGLPLRYRAADVRDPRAMAALVDEAEAAFGPLDVLFNNAAIFDMGPLLDSDEAMYQRLFDVNVKGMFFTMQAVLRAMRRAERPGAVINMASQAGRRGEALVAHYCATKAAVISYTQSAALAMAPHGIRVNAISPGVVDTPMWDHVDSLFARYEHLQPGEKKIAVGRAVPLGRMGRPDDLCGAAVFLASDESRYVTAQTLNVDGGNVMS
jgi:D-sorbitol dehydrogenase (acceptor)